MDRDRLGLIGGIAADRPLLVVLLLALGLMALSVVGAAEAPSSGSYGVIANTLIAGVLLVVAPLLLIAALPNAFAARVLASVVVFLAAVTVTHFFDSSIAYRGVSIPTRSVSAFAYLLAVLLLIGPLFGSPVRFAFIAAASALLGTAGGMGLIFSDGVYANNGGAFVAAAFATGSIAGISAITDFTALFARGAEKRRAAAVSAQYYSSTFVYSMTVTAAAFGILLVTSLQADAALTASWLVAACVALAGAPALFTTIGALSLRRSNELLAVEENRRRQSFRRSWRPLRRALPPSTSLAIIGIAAVAVIAAAFNLSAPYPLEKLLFSVLSALVAGLVFFSMRTGLFVFLTLIICGVLVAWFWGAWSAPRLSPMDEAAVMAVAATLFGHLAVSWRDARSPRLNARETTEAAMTDAFGLYGLSSIVAVASFCAAAQAGIWPGGAVAGAYLGCLAALGMALAPAIMTALSHSAGRDLF